MYVLGICWVCPGRMEYGGGGVVWFWWTSGIVRNTMEAVGELEL